MERSCVICKKIEKYLTKKLCRSCYYRQNKDKILDKKRLFYLKNKEKLKAKNGEYYLENKHKLLDQKRSYYANNKKNIALVKNKNYKKNKAKIIKHNLEYIIKRSQKDPLYKMTRNLRSRLYSAIKNSYKTGSAIKDLGCSILELKSHLESMFQPGMTWDNYGRGGWHIDHIRPLSSFDLSDSEQLQKACNYMNLQPLWEAENLYKGSKYGL